MPDAAGLELQRAGDLVQPLDAIGRLTAARTTPGVARALHVGVGESVANVTVARVGLPWITRMRFDTPRIQRNTAPSQRKTRGVASLTR